MTPPFTLTLELPADQATAFAEFLKRTRLNDYEAKCPPHDRAAAALMQSAGERVRQALAAEGIDPR